MAASPALMMPELGWVEVEAETTYGTNPDSNPFALIITEEPDVPVPNRQNIEDTRVRPDGSREPHGVIDRHVSGSFQTLIAPLPDSDGAVPSVAPLLKAAGFSETLTGTAAGGDLTATYDRTYRAIGSCTLTFYWADKESTTDWTKLTVPGVRCSFDLDYSLGGRILMNVTFQGLFAEWQDFADVSSEQPSQFHQGKTPFETQNHSFTIAGTSVSLSQWALDVGASTSEIEEVMAASTAKEIILNNLDSAVTGSYNPLVESIGATDDVMQRRKSGDEETMTLTVTRGSDEFEFKAQQTQINEDPGFSQEDKFYRYDAGFVCNNPGSGNPEAQLEWRETS